MLTIMIKISCCRDLIIPISERQRNWSKKICSKIWYLKIWLFVVMQITNILEQLQPMTKISQDTCRNSFIILWYRFYLLCRVRLQKISREFLAWTSLLYLTKTQLLPQMIPRLRRPFKLLTSCETSKLQLFKTNFQVTSRENPQLAIWKLSIWKYSICIAYCCPTQNPSIKK